MHPSVPQSIVIKSSAFKEAANIPSKYTCDGANVSPPLEWQGVPRDKTKSLALICTDPDAPGGEWTHWLIWNLPPPTRKLLEGFAGKSTLANGAVQGTNDFKKVGYGGPCPPSGSHRYVFAIYALDEEIKLPSTSEKTELLKAMQNHILAQGQLTGKYGRTGQ